MSRVASFRIGKGKTTRPSESEEWLRNYLEIEIQLPERVTEEGFWEAVAKAEAMVDRWLGKGAAEAPTLPSLEAINALPWISYRSKEPCKSADEAGWIWCDPSRHSPDKSGNVRQLALALDKAPRNRLEIGEMLYSFSGPEEDPRLFISRRPLPKRG